MEKGEDERINRETWRRRIQRVEEDKVDKVGISRLRRWGRAR